MERTYKKTVIVLVKVQLSQDHMPVLDPHQLAAGIVKDAMEEHGEARKDIPRKQRTLQRWDVLGGVDAGKAGAR
ncbi:MAG TPA: hypothetical protein VFF76_00360 [Holophagaceae bacterium]|jgi:hypothetical protein|nr:hypothetical protein [Holophagaceae bacterium]